MTVQSLRLEKNALEGKIIELQQKIETSSILFTKTPSEAGAKIIQELESEKHRLEAELATTQEAVFLHDHRKNWREVKAMLESLLGAPLNTESKWDAKSGKSIDTVTKRMKPLPEGWQAIPVSIKKTDDKLEFIRHIENSNESDIIALRESLRSYIHRINIDLPSMKAVIEFKAGIKVNMDFKKSNSYPRRYYYKTADTDWIEINAS